MADETKESGENVKTDEAAQAAKAEEAAKTEEEAARQLAEDEANQAARIAADDAGLSPVDRVIRRLNDDFCRDLPQEARAGSYEPGDDGRFAGAYDVPNGRYRVTGQEWVFEIKGKKLVAATRATQANKWGGKNVVAVG